MAIGCQPDDSRILIVFAELKPQAAWCGGRVRRPYACDRAPEQAPPGLVLSRVLKALGQSFARLQMNGVNLSRRGLDANQQATRLEGEKESRRRASRTPALALYLEER